MKKHLVVLMVVCSIVAISVPSYAGDIDGIWGLSDNYDSLYMIRENGGTVVLVALDMKDQDWAALMGTQSGSTVRLFSTGFTGGENLDVTMTIISNTSATVRINSCSPASKCVFHSGHQFAVQKLF